MFAFFSRLREMYRKAMALSDAEHGIVTMHNLGYDDVEIARWLNSRARRQADCPLTAEDVHKVLLPVQSRDK